MTIVINAFKSAVRLVATTLVVLVTVIVALSVVVAVLA